MNVSLPIIAYGGMCHADFSMALARLYIEASNREGYSFSSSCISFESLISRGRNSAAACALSTNADYLMFIDTDIAFNPEDVFKLLSHDKDVVCGTYPKKFVNNDKVDFFFDNFHKLRDSSVVKKGNWRNLCTDPSTEITELAISQHHKGNKLLEVDYAATGFMLIKTKVFKKIIEAKPEIKYENEIDGYLDYGDNFYDFFPVQINPSTKKYESEDYGFCNLWRSLGGKIHIDPTIKLGHIGRYLYVTDLQKQLNIFSPNHGK